ncbi:alpha/beta fold hydrolase [Nonomuraea pusilla]|uniref:Pimeloyl-ACP methyl ester carboxylesterase n=1 Tax=Nonomuraea pusilla TaxID=46177 RepID=A0A1H7L1R9_9ACTN|nr:alpha/beta hydrolase [Nonomuraea pusilla]SEK92764.1 Pimeloyl-ACP methyl ester carboxylesterase [Nonomuraea pusilla]
MTETTTTVPVAGGSLNVRTEGRAGPALVFVHYWGGSAGTWSGVIGHLPAGQATVRFDQRGWGASRALPGPYHLDRLADDLVRVVEASVPGPFVLVGHSMGGKVSQLVAARRPAGLAGLVLVAPAPPRPPATVTEEYRQGLSHAYDSPEAVRHALDQVLTATPLPETVRDAAVRDSLAAGAEARHEWPLRGIGQDITSAARDIEVPVTVLAGENDVVEPPHVLREHLLPFVPHATLTTVPDVGHLLPLEAPGAVAAALGEFLTAVQR